MRTSTYSLDEIASRFDLTIKGDGARLIRGVSTLSNATSEHLSFFANTHYRSQLQVTQAGAVVLRANDIENCPTTSLIATDPYVAYAKIATLFENVPQKLTGIHPTAIISKEAYVAPSASIGPYCVIEEGSHIEDGAIVDAHCTIGPHCIIGAQSHLLPRVTLVTHVKLGQRVLVHSGAVIGADGFGLAFDQDRWIKVPQLGGVNIGNDCEIGANTCIDRGALEDTILEEDVRLDNHIQIAHNVFIGAHTAIAGCAAVAGSTHIGRYCLIGGGTGILGHLHIADRVTITAMSLVTHSLRQTGEYSSGTPIQNNRLWRRNAARFKHLDALAQRLAVIEKEIK